MSYERKRIHELEDRIEELEKKHMSGDHNKYHMKLEVVKDDCVCLTSKETSELIQALEDAVYFLNPTDADMREKTGVYRIVTALKKLKAENT